MPMNTTTTQSGVNYGEKLETTAALKTKTGEETQKAASLDSDSKELLLRAQQNALEAKEAALGAINRFYEESKASETKAGKMLNELEGALQLALNASKNSSQASNYPANMPHDKKDLKASRKILNAKNPFGIISDLKNSLLGTKSTDVDVKEEFYRLVMRKSPQLRQLIDDLTDDKARIKIDKIITEAKSEIAAALAAVSKTQQEINATRVEAQKAYIYAENTRKAAELLVSRVKQVTLSEAADEIVDAEEEIKAAKEAANAAIQRAEEEIRKNCEEAATLDRNAQVTVTLANEKIRKYAEELKAYKLQANIAVKKAQDEAQQARAEAETARREAQEVINRVASDRQQAEADKETARQMMQEAKVIAETRQYDEFIEEVKRMREEVDVVNQRAQEVIAKAQRESREVKEELDMMKRVSNKVVNTARHETDEAHEEAERAKQAMFNIANQSQEEHRKIRQEAEVSVVRAREAMTQAKKDIVNLTRDEIIRSKQELEALGKASKSVNKPISQKLDTENVANVLHEMRSPLHSICGFAKLLKEDDVPDENTRKEFLSIMEQQSESLKKLVDDLSGILNNKSEALAIKSEPISSYTMITKAIDSVQTIAQQKKNLISHNLVPDLPEINADAFRIKQVITNLLTNAIKFSPENRPIFVKAGMRGNELLVQVIDYGIGIPKGELSAIFNKNYRAENHGDIDGKGLGLYICRQIIKAHGGNIWAESVEGEGSTFCFSLPIDSARQRENKQVEQSYAG
ncbi:MAG: hypothetical protein A2Y89_05335 [Chloroflexi bacterium RBG_13_51_18]|nr:MAG: hypothetical protein A2Y89_05335 [Chloroflexi bacterium RBG_13_51_18]